MFKKINMIMLGVLVVTFCVAMMPQRVEASNLRFYGKHKHRWELGEASLDGDYMSKSRLFMTSWGKKYSVTLRELYANTYSYKVESKWCSASKSGRVYISSDDPNKNFKLEVNY